MEVSLARTPVVEPRLPPDYRLIPWSPTLLAFHAEAKHRSFQWEVDANVFPCLGDLEGCRQLMADIAMRRGFLACSTWLAIYQPARTPPQPCGTIQGIRTDPLVGGIQNLGITPDHRGRGLGTCLLLHALEGFRHAGLARATLEVTAHNTSAIRLYQRIGFRSVRTIYKAVEVAYC